MRNEAMLNEFIELVTTDCASGKEGMVADKLVKKLTDLGFTVTRDKAGDLFDGECGNVIGIREGELSGSLLLSSHMDRVPNGIGIKPVEKDGVIYSDGTTILAADDLSGVAAILDGLRRVLETGKPLPRLEVIFSVGEEAGLWGAKGMDLSMLKSEIGYIFDSPGSTGRFLNSAPGMYRLGCDVHGLAAHAGNEPEKGINAAKIMCEILAGLPQGKLNENSTSNFPIISTGTKVRNVVCDFASFKGEARSRDAQYLEEYVAAFEKRCHEVAEAAGATVEIHKDMEFAPFHIDENEEMIAIAAKACEKIGLKARFEAGGGGMDCNVYNAKGMKTIGVASGYTRNHTSLEQLVLEDFFKSGELAQSLIETFAETLK